MAASAAAAEEYGLEAQSATNFVPGWATQPSLEPGAADPEALLPQGSATDPEAAEVLPRNDLERPEAVELAVGVFGDVIESASGIYDELEVDRFHSDYIAVVSGDAQPGLLSSTLPLRTIDSDGEKSIVDLDLQREGDALEPDNPLVAVEIPTELGDGIALPKSGTTIELDDAPAGRAPSTVGEGTAFYPNVGGDTDLAVAPTPTGVETSVILRTPDAPLTHSYRIGMPDGAQLEPTPDGGAKVIKSGDPLMTIRKPTAMDAAGEPVAVAFEVEGSSIEISVEPGAETSYPVLVDPIFESYYWDMFPAEASPEWVLTAGPGPRFEATWYAGPNFYVPGIHLLSHTGSTTPGTQAMANYYVPRFFADYNDPTVQARPTSYIKRMTMTHVAFTVWNYPEQPYPAMQLGLWSESKGQWVSYGTMNSLEAKNLTPAFVFDMQNPNEVTDAKNGGISLFTGGGTAYTRSIDVGQATVEISDKESPAFALLGSASGWVRDQPSAAINYTVSDTGLGVHELQVQQPSAVGGSSTVKTAVGCLGSARGPCPRMVKASDKALGYSPATMPQGEHWLKVTATDPVLQKSSVGEARVRVDRTAPKLALSGTLTEQANLGTNLEHYTLKYAATDGDDAAAAALTPIGSQGAGAGQFQRPQGIEIDANGNFWVADTSNNRIVKYSAVGAQLKQVGALGPGAGNFNAPLGLAISSGGSIWVADSGNNRLQQFNANGEFVKAISSPKFASLWGVATAPGGVVWVVDRNRQQAFKFRESDGAFLGETTKGQLVDPTGIAADDAGRVWIVDHQSHKVVVYNGQGIEQFQFGTYGSGNGQLSFPVGIALTPSGNALIVDRLNHRIQEFEADGSYLRQFGSKGTAGSQFNEPHEIAIRPDGTAWITDTGSHRIVRWSHADFNPQSGVVKAEIKVDGQIVKTDTQSCSKTCPLSKEWTLDADDYAVGQHTVEVIATDGVGLPTPKTLTIETHGDLKDPAIALSGTMTEQASLGTTRPSYALQVNASDPGESNERKSGVASVKVKVDGSEVKSSSPGCPAGGCSLSTEWTLSSPSYSAGSHNVEVIATDAAGRTSSKALAVNVQRDTTPPTVTAANAFYDAPEGWVEQKSYAINATGKDEVGFGVTSMTLKIDGEVVRSSSQGCPSGGCSLQMGLGEPLNMAGYEGGAHSAELRVVDGAGNVAKTVWTINVSPSGSVNSSESESTLEALDETSESELVAPTSQFLTEQETEHGNNPELTAGAASVITTGVPNSSEIALDPDDGFTVELPDGILHAEPVDVADEASEMSIVDDSVVIASNTKLSTDTVIRPIYDGVQTFATIRDLDGPEEFAWEVALESDQQLVSTGPESAEVRYGDGHVAFSIIAQPAHDAVGATVPTLISVSDGNILTLTVGHSSAPFVYPVTGGAGWEGGFVTTTVVMPPIASNDEPDEPWEKFDEPFHPYAPEQNQTIPPTTFPLKTLKAKVGAPRAGAAGPNGQWKEKRAYTEYCSDFDCSYWKVELKGYFNYNGNVAIPIKDIRPYVCRLPGHPLIFRDIRKMLWFGKSIAHKSQHERLGLGCVFDVSILVPELGLEEARHMVKLLMYPSGYYTSEIQEIQPWVQQN